MKRFITCVLTGIMFASLLSGCGSMPVLAFSPTTTPTATLVPTPLPTNTPEPGRVTLVAPPEALPDQVKAISDAIQPIISQSGLILETLAQVPSGSLGPNRKAAIFLSVPGNLVDIIAANPQTQILVISNADLQTGPTLTVIRDHPENVAFMAGYVTALVAPNWRAAGLLPDDGGESSILANAFMTGGRYLCGRCGTSTPPFAAYPLTETASSGASAIEWQEAASAILPAGLESLYFSKEAQSPELLQSLVSQNILFLGATFPGEEYRNRWAATVSSDTLDAVVKAMPDILAGQGGKVIQSGITLSDINEAYITPGKQRLIDQTNEQLSKGWINPLTISD